MKKKHLLYPQTAKQATANKVPLVVGLMICLLTPVTLVLDAFWLLRRRRRTFVGRHAHTARLLRIPPAPGYTGYTAVKLAAE